MLFNFRAMDSWAVSFLLDDSVAVVIGEVILNLIGNLIGYINVVEQFKYRFGLFHLIRKNSRFSFTLYGSKARCRAASS